MEASTIITLILFIGLAWLGLRFLRQKYLTPYLLEKLPKTLPTISPTERAALEAGNTWWEKELFSGKPRWKKLFSIPKPSLSIDEQHFIDQQVEELCGMLDDWDIVNNRKDLPANVWDYLKKEKFFGLVIPKEYGGYGFSALAHSTVVTKIATRSISAAVNTMVPNSLGPAELLLHYGTEDQKSHYLPRLASGQEIPCFALTAPDAGSDAGSIPDRGVICRQKFNGEEVLGIKLNWDKRYITLAPVATLLGLAFQLYDPDQLFSKKENLGITLALLPTTHPGVEIGSRHLPLQLAFMNGPTRGKDVFIPLDWVIGGPDMLGQGWGMLMECLSIGRSISLPALSAACGKLTYRNTGAYARLRQQFNAPLSAFEGIQEALSNIAGLTYIMESTRIMTAGAVDLKVKPSIASAIAKYHMTEMSRKVIDSAMDIHAGHMIQAGPRNFLANLHFSIPISITVEGANILTRNLIIFGQGAIRCHPYLLEEIELLSSEEPDEQALDRVIAKHIRFFAGNTIRNLWHGITGGFFIRSRFKNDQVRACHKQLSRMSTALAFYADTSLILLGGSLKRRERISARLGDVMSELYLASAALKYYIDNNQLESEVKYVVWSLKRCLHRTQNALDEISDNYPYRWLGKIMRFATFPLGRAYAAPADDLSQAIVRSMLSHSTLRDRLTQYCYVSKDSSELSWQMEEGLKQIDMVEPLIKKLQKALRNKLISLMLDFDERLTKAEEIGVLTSAEVKILTDYEILRSEIIKVNEFSFDLNEVIA